MQDQAARAPKPGRTPGGGNDVELAVGRTSNAELVKYLEVGQSNSNAKREVVLSLAPSAVPDLQPKDRLFVPCEVEVTSQADIGQIGPGTNFDPEVEAEIVLASGKHATKGRRVGHKSSKVSKNEHHHVFVFDRSAAAIEITAGDLKHGKPFVNLVMWAHASGARAGGKDKVLVGENEGDFLHDHQAPAGDKGRISAVRERGGAHGQTRTVKSQGSHGVPGNGKATFLGSALLAQQPLEAGDEFSVTMTATAHGSGRPRLAAKLGLSEQAHDDEPKNRNDVDPGSISERNGFNVLGSERFEKVAVFRVSKQIGQPLHIILSGDSRVPGGGAANLSVSDVKFEITRYAAK